MRLSDGALVSCWDRMASNVSDLLLLPCGVAGSRCNGSGACAAEPFSCVGGFNASSRLCSRCPSSSFQSGNECVACSQWIPAVALASLVAAVCVAIGAHKQRYSPASVSTISASLFFLQLSGVLRQRSQLTARVGGASAGLAVVPAWLEQVSVLGPSVFQCWATCDDNCQFFVLAAAVACVWLAAAAVSLCWSAHSSAARRASLVALGLLYFPVSLSAVSTFNCEQVELVSGGGQLSFLASAPYVDCGGAEFDARWWMSVALCVVFVAGLPLAKAFALIGASRSVVEEHTLALDYLPTPTHAAAAAAAAAAEVRRASRDCPY